MFFVLSVTKRKDGNAYYIWQLQVILRINCWTKHFCWGGLKSCQLFFCVYRKTAVERNCKQFAKFPITWTSFCVEWKETNTSSSYKVAPSCQREISWNRNKLVVSKSSKDSLARHSYHVEKEIVFPKKIVFIHVAEWGKLANN